MTFWSESRPFGRRAALLAGLCLALPAAAPAQQPARPAQAQGSDKADALQKRDEELKALREQQQKSTEAEAEIKRQIEEIGNDRRKLNQALIDSAAKLREVETKVSDTETRLKPLDAQEATIRSSLEGRRSVIGEVLAALQRIGRRPPPALIASPEDALQAVRTAMVLGAVLPEMRDQVADLAKDLSGLLAVRKKIDEERDTLKKQLQSAPSTLSDEERSSRLRTIDTKEKQLQRDAEDAQSAYNADLQDALGKVAQKLGPTVVKYVKDNGYTLLLDISGQQGGVSVMWAAPGTDISQAIIEAYNASSGVPAPVPSAPTPHTHSGTTTHPATTTKK